MHLHRSLVGSLCARIQYRPASSPGATIFRSAAVCEHQPQPSAVPTRCGWVFDHIRAPFRLRLLGLVGYHFTMTVLEVIQKSAEYLAKKGLESPRLQVELLLAHALKIPRLNLYLDFERGLSDAEIADVRQMVKRRGRREPLQHILGSTSFCGLEMRVTPAVLVPRPETELLAERAWRFLCIRQASSNMHPDTEPTPEPLPGRGAERGTADQSSPPGRGAGVGSFVENLAQNESVAPAVLDFGTGSGCLAVSIAVNAPAARVWALEISEAALEVATQNAALHHVSDRIQFVQGDGIAALPAGIQFDLIVSNPPYIASREIDSLQPEVRDHDPRIALDGGEDGLNFFRAFAAQAKTFLRPSGKLMAEFGDGQEQAIERLFRDRGWLIEAVGRDYAGRPRILVAQP
ncbi:MAG: peptide chain release factor N(5)-glutamine methyltransferase [Verrucomicrobia bacterium]|nr:peptide chain release factor N(5)-glutamine methyltransferase [Verrucomicrobiota bacterium]